MSVFNLLHMYSARSIPFCSELALSLSLFALSLDKMKDENWERDKESPPPPTLSLASFLPFFEKIEFPK